MSGAYASWFARHSLDSLLDSSNENLLLTVLSLCLSAATALRNLCEANRTALAVHIGAFGELHVRFTLVSFIYTFVGRIQREAKFFSLSQV